MFVSELNCVHRNRQRKNRLLLELSCGTPYELSSNQHIHSHFSELGYKLGCRLRNQMNYLGDTVVQRTIA